MMRRFGFTIPFLALAACGGEDDGAVDVRVYGESFVEDGIPADEMADGWAVTFDRFDVEVLQVELAGASWTEGRTMALARPSAGEGHALTTLAVPAGAHSGAGFVLGDVTVEGRATKDGVDKTFAWSFPGSTTYADCEHETVAGEAAPGTFEITVHADHLFFDSLVSEEPQVVFADLAAADDDDDGQITQAELADADIGGFDPGNLDISNLWAWLEAQVANVGHADGEGHCDAASGGR